MPSAVRLLRPTISAALALLLAVPAAAQDLDTVEEQVAQLEERVAAATAAYEDTWAKAEDAEAELRRMQAETQRLEQDAAELAEVLIDRARSVFMHGSDTSLISMFTATGPRDAIERAALISTITTRDSTRLEEVANLRTQLAQARRLQRDKAEELATLQAQMAETTAALEDDLASARVVLDDLQARASRQRQISRESQQGVYACIFEPPFHFRNTWGDPRSGGRRHKGTDVFSWYGAPVYAFTSGRIHRMSNSGLGGIGLYLFGDDGNLYYYAHLDSIAETIYVGKRVEAGELVAYNGDSGNARGGPPHVHYQMHPGGGGPVNPYQWLAAACF